MPQRFVKPKSVLAICGSGNGGHALAVVASQTFDGDINWLVHSEETAGLVHESLSRDGLRSTGVITARADRLRVVSSDAADVIPDADIVMIVAPAFAHAEILAQIAPHLKESVLIGCLPSRGGFEFEVGRLIPGIEPEGRRRIFGLQTLPWSTRVTEKGSIVNVGAIKAKVLMAALPAWHAPEMAAQVSEILGIELVPTATFMDMTLGNPGQFIHPGLLYGHLASSPGVIFGPDSIPGLFADVTDQMGVLLEMMSDEALSVARTFEAKSKGRLDLSGTLRVLDWLRLSYPSQTSDTSTVAACFRTGPLQVRRVPTTETSEGLLVADFSGRYLTEDLPFGLVVTRAIAELAQVDTPAIDRVIAWAQEKMGKKYLVDGKLDPHATRDLPIPQHIGCQTPEDLINWYCVQPGYGIDRRMSGAR